jgi:hypothetical protein
LAARPSDRPTASASRLDPSPVNVRVKIAAAWTSTMFVFAYVDLFGLYRADVRKELDAGTIGGFAVGQPFLLATLAFVAVPSLMVLLALVLPPRLNRITNIALACAYTAAIIASAIGEWHYYLLGSAVELALLAAVAYWSWTWPRRPLQA